MEIGVRARRRALAVVLASFGYLLPTAALATTFDPAGIVFPAIGEFTFIDDFNSLRSGGRIHGATDIMTGGVYGLPVVAAADGTVGWIGSTCCYLSIDHGDGWETWYIHLNNDTPGTDDGLGWGIAPGIVPGTPVVRGQLIGWVGDSGNAETVGPHLHFEIRQGGIPVNPYPYLLAAPRLSAPLTPMFRGHFRDDEGSPHEADIDTLFESGITYGCSSDGLYCPNEEISRGQIAAFINRAFDLPTADFDYFDDDTANLFEPDINAITAAGIGFGCTESDFCPDRPLLREEMAELLARAFRVPAAPTDYFTDDEASPYQASINALRQAGITKGCDPLDPAFFCPLRPLTRAEMASFFVRAMGL